jgi:hypothetical protein
MRTIVTAIILIGCSILTFAQEATQDVTSKISKVTVFLEGAQITRSSSVNLKPGVSSLSLTGIAAHIQEQSIQVDGPSAVKILSVSFRVNYLDNVRKPERITFLESERRRLHAQIAEERSREEVFKEEESILKTNKSIGGTARGVEIEELKVAMDYFRQRLSEIKQRLLQIDRTIRKHQEEVGKIEAQLTELSAMREEPTGEIALKVSSPTAIKADLKITYLVKQARWYPTYDIRAKNIQSPISITYKANVSQQSGEDWDNVELTVSTANPNEGGAKPVIKPWILGFNNAVANRNQNIGTIEDKPTVGIANSLVRGRVTGTDGEALPGVNVIIQGTTVGTVSDADGYYSLPLTSDARSLVFSFIGFSTEEVNIQSRDVVDVRLHEDEQHLDEVVVVGYGVEREARSLAYATSSAARPRVKKTIVATPVVRQTNIEYTVDEPFSIKSDGEKRTTDMMEYELDALYEYYCAPKLDPDAFLTAKILNWDEYNFLEGEASLFFEGKYIGKSILDTRNTADTLTLSLGRDGNVVVNRDKKKDYSSRQFVGANQKIMFKYEIAIRNKKDQPITIVVVDQIPLSNDKEIEVDKLEDSKAEYEKDSGLLTWKKQITPDKTEMIKLSYAIKYPKGNNIILE